MACLFCKIVSGEIPATLIYDLPDLIVIKDIDAQAPSHFLVIPKRHINTINEIRTPQDEQLLGKMIAAAKEMAIKENINEDGYRLVFNVNADGGQSVYHIHLHLLGGRKMAWPPG